MKKHKNLLLLAAIVVIIVGAFLFAPKGVEYSGTCLLYTSRSLSSAGGQDEIPFGAVAAESEAGSQH